MFDGVHMWVTGKPVTLVWALLLDSAHSVCIGSREMGSGGRVGCCAVLCSGSCELCD